MVLTVLEEQMGFTKMENEIQLPNPYMFPIDGGVFLDHGFLMREQLQSLGPALISANSLIQWNCPLAKLLLSLRRSY